MTDKEKVLEMYKEAAIGTLKTLKATEASEYDSNQRELFAEQYGRRQAFGRVLEEVYGVNGEELQRILDDLNGK